MVFKNLTKYSFSHIFLTFFTVTKTTNILLFFQRIAFRFLLSRVLNKE